MIFLSLCLTVLLGTVSIADFNDPENPLWIKNDMYEIDRDLLFSDQDVVDYSAPIVTTEFKNITKEDTTGTERFYWYKLLSGTDAPLNTYTALRKLADLRKGQNFVYNGIKSVDIDMLIGIKPLRLVNCSPDIIKERYKFRPPYPILRTINLAEYYRIYDSRQNRVCWQIYEMMLEESFNGIPQYKREPIFRLTTLMERSYQYLDGIFPQDLSLIPRILLEFIYEDPSRRSDLEKLARESELRPARIRDLIEGWINCVQIYNTTKDYLDYLDNSFLPGDQRRSTINITHNTKRRLSATRVCQNFIYNTSLHKSIIEEMSKELKIPINYMDAGEILIPLHTTISAMEYNLSKTPEANETTSDESELKLIEDLDLDEEEKSLWFKLGEEFPRYVEKSLIELEKIYRNKLPSQYKGLKTQRLREFMELSSVRLINCNPKIARRHLELIDGQELNQFPGLLKYIKFHVVRQDKICWDIFDMMMQEKDDDLYQGLSAKMGNIKIRNHVENNGNQLAISVFDEPIYDAVTKFIWIDPMFRTGPTDHQLMPSEMKIIIQEATEKPCFFIENAYGDFVDYIDELMPNSERRIPKLRVRTKLWLAYNRICRAFKDLNFFNQIYLRINERLDKMVRETILPMTPTKKIFKVHPCRNSHPGLPWKGARVIQFNQLDSEDANFWEDLSKEEVDMDPKDIYHSLNKFKERYQKMNVILDFFQWPDIDFLLDLRDVRLENCFYDRVIHRNRMIDDFDLEVRPNLKKYIEFYVRRQNVICFVTMDDMIAAKYDDLSMNLIDTMIDMDPDDSYIGKMDLALEVPEDLDILAKFTIDLLMKSPNINHYVNRVKKSVGRKNLPIMHEVRQVYGQSCVIVNESFGLFVDYFDELFPNGEFKKLGLSFSALANFWMGKVRFCRALFGNRKLQYSIHKNLNRLICPEGILYGDLVNGVVYSYWKPWSVEKSDPGPSYTRRTFDERWIDHMESSKTFQDYDSTMRSLASVQNRMLAVSDKPTVFKLFYDDPNWDLADHTGCWERLRDDTLNMSNQGYEVRKILESLLRPFEGEYNGIKELTNDEIKKLIAVSPARILNCDIERFVNMKLLLRAPYVRGNIHLSDYVEHYDKVQSKLCWDMFRLMLQSNINEMVDQAVVDNVLNPILKFCTDIGVAFRTSVMCAIRGVARMLLNNPKAVQITKEYPGDRASHELAMEPIMRDTFMEACSQLIEAVQDFVAYEDHMRAYGIKHTPSEEEYRMAANWVERGRLCIKLAANTEYRRQIYSEMFAIYRGN